VRFLDATDSRLSTGLEVFREPNLGLGVGLDAFMVVTDVRHI
jgi:hypothetical protein